MAKQWFHIHKDLRQFDESTEKQLAELQAKHTLSHCERIQQECAAHFDEHGRVPQDTHGILGRPLGRLLKRAREQLDKMTDVPPEIVAMRRRLDENRTLGTGWTKKERDRCQRVLRVIQEQLQERCSAWYRMRDRHARPEIPLLQLTAVKGKGFAGVSPYPGFVNLASTCWNNSVLQCLFHCHAVRDALAGKESGPAQSFATQLARLLRTFVDGVCLPDLPVTHAKMDIIAPHDFIDFVESASKRFNVGPQHDAAEFLSWSLEKSELGHACCHVGAGCRNDNGVVLLEQFALQSTQADICRAQRIDMQNLLRSSLQHDDTRLRHLPSILVLRVPQILYGDATSEHEWIQPIDNPDDVPVSWGDVFF